MAGWGLVEVYLGESVLGVKDVKAYKYKDCRQEGVAAHNNHLKVDRHGASKGKNEEMQLM